MTACSSTTAAWVRTRTWSSGAEKHESRWPKGHREHRSPRGNNFATAGACASVIDGERYVAWLVFVGNGRYGENLRDVSTREALDGNLLDVRVVHADQPLARLRLFAAVFFGRLALTPVVDAAGVPASHDRGAPARAGSRVARRRSRAFRDAARLRVAIGRVARADHSSSERTEARSPAGPVSPTLAGPPLGLSMP